MSDIPIFLDRMFSFSGGQKVNYDELIFIPIVMMAMQYYEYTPAMLTWIQKRFWVVAIPTSVILLFLLSELGNKQVQFIYFQF